MSTWLIMIAGVVGLLATFSGASNCPTTPNFYRDLNCTVAATSADGCPTRFDCPLNHGNSTDQCQYHGKLYKENEPVDAKDAPECSAYCQCVSDGSSMSFRCAQVECPELFNPSPQECVLQSKPNQCCSHNKICDAKLVEQLPTCYMGGQQYRLQQEMYPADSCYKCFCAEDFDNTTIVGNPNCVEINCASEIHYLPKIRAGCIPIYFNDAKCCPSYEWKCPTNDDKVIASEQRLTPVDEADKCTFGNLTLARGDKVAHDKPCVTCICDMPPIPTCIEKRSCDNEEPESTDDIIKSPK